MANNIEVTYEKVTRSYQALNILITGKLFSDNGKMFMPSYGIATVLKIKRMINSMNPIIEQLNELKEELRKKYDWNASGNPPFELEREFSEALRVQFTISAEKLSVEELIGSEKVPASIIGVLLDLEPFLES